MAIRKPVPREPRAPRQRPPTTRKRKLNIWEQAIELAKSIPDEEAARAPRDGALNHDHYIYGTPKKYDDAGGRL